LTGTKAAKAQKVSASQTEQESWLRPVLFLHKVAAALDIGAYRAGLAGVVPAGCGEGRRRGTWGELRGDKRKVAARGCGHLA